MLVAELRKEQEQNRILRIELEKAKREKNFAEMDAYAAICMFNDESRKVQSHINRHKAEIERLKAETSNIRRETAKEILDMLYDIGIDKETLECCRIFDVNGVSLAKQICEKYGVEVEQ